MATVAATRFKGFFDELKEIEDAYHLEVLKLRRRQREALRRIEVEAERRDVEAMKKRVSKTYGTGA
jgi:hypothetical protein